jgi:RNA polymerase sigma-70 factor (ECF subfamily)
VNTGPDASNVRSGATAAPTTDRWLRADEPHLRHRTAGAIARSRHDHFRKEKIRKKESVDDWQDKLQSDENHFEEFKKSEELMILSTALEKLPEDKREVLLLSKFHEKKYKDIGEILGCSEGAVKVKVFRALQDLKDLYQQLDRRM